jgi:hypothetical protein
MGDPSYFISVLQYMFTRETESTVDSHQSRVEAKFISPDSRQNEHVAQLLNFELTK